MTMDERFEEAIKEQKFTYHMILGFSSDPRLAVKAGMAMGYAMAAQDLHKDVMEKLDIKIEDIKNSVATHRRG